GLNTETMDKSIKDEELQRMIFEAKYDDGSGFGKGDFDNENGDCYKILKRALETAPQTDLPENFAFLVTQKAARKKHLYDIFRKVALYFGAFSVFITFCALALLFLARDILHFLIDG